MICATNLYKNMRPIGYIFFSCVPVYCKKEMEVYAMTQAQYFKNLTTPAGKVDVVLDTDAYNEIDDQFAIAYMLRSEERINVKGICAAPFFNEKSTSPADGMERSYQEIFKILELSGLTSLSDRVFRGSEHYLENEQTPVLSDSARFMAELAKQYSPEHPLYIVAIGAITNVASALLLNPDMKKNTVIVWLGGNALHMNDTQEFNMFQDIAAARVVFGCGAPVVQLPCRGVVDRFVTSRYELEHWLSGKNELCDYLLKIAVRDGERYTSYPAWTRVIWDVTAVAWLLNDDHRFLSDCLVHSPIPEYDHHYASDCSRHLIDYVYHVNRDALFTDLFEKLAK